MIVFFEGIFDSKKVFKEKDCFLQNIKDEVFTLLKQITSTHNSIDSHWNKTMLIRSLEDELSR